MIIASANIASHVDHLFNNFSLDECNPFVFCCSLTKSCMRIRAVFNIKIMSNLHSYMSNITEKKQWSELCHIHEMHRNSNMNSDRKNCIQAGNRTYEWFLFSSPKSIFYFRVDQSPKSLIDVVHMHNASRPQWIHMRFLFHCVGFLFYNNNLTYI